MNTELEILPSNFNVHLFSTNIGDKKVLYQVLKMKDSIMVFINYKYAMYFSDLSLAMNSIYDKTPLCSKLVGDFKEDPSKPIAIKLAKKLNKVVYVSYNVEGDKLILPVIENQLFKEIKDHPDKF